MDNNSKRYDGKVNKEYIANIVRDKPGKLKTGERVKVKYTVRGKTSLWNAEIVDYPLKQNKKRKKKLEVPEQRPKKHKGNGIVIEASGDAATETNSDNEQGEEIEKQHTESNSGDKTDGSDDEQGKAREDEKQHDKIVKSVEVQTIDVGAVETKHAHTQTDSGSMNELVLTEMMDIKNRLEVIEKLLRQATSGERNLFREEPTMLVGEYNPDDDVPLLPPPVPLLPPPILASNTATTIAPPIVPSPVTTPSRLLSSIDSSHLIDISDISDIQLEAILNEVSPNRPAKTMKSPTPTNSKTVEDILKNRYRDAPKLARDLARAVFGEEALKSSTVTGRLVRGQKTNMLDMEKLLSVKGLVKSKFSSLSVVEFEVVWVRCVKSIADLCKKLREDHITII